MATLPTPNRPPRRLAAMLATVLNGEPAVARWWRGLLLVLLCVITLLALAPAPPKEADLGWDKLNHFAAFAALAVVATLGYARATVAVAIGLLAYGALIELLQSLTPSRSAEWADLVADGIGIGIGLLVAALLARLVRWLTPAR